jgi:hypothetical protein
VALVASRRSIGVLEGFGPAEKHGRYGSSDSCSPQRLHELNYKSQHHQHIGWKNNSHADKSANPAITMDGPSLASLSLTHVHYDPTNKISHACAYLALVPQALCITYATLIWSSREMEILLMFAGQMACEAFNWVLKRSIREDRPAQMLGKGYGMPSSHAQFVAFFAVYLGLWVVVRHDPWKTNESKTHIPTPMWQRIGLALAALGGAVAVAQSRMYVLITFCLPNFESSNTLSAISITIRRVRFTPALRLAPYAALHGLLSLQLEDITA